MPQINKRSKQIAESNTTNKPRFFLITSNILYSKFNKRVTTSIINLFKKCNHRKILVNFSILFATKILAVNNSDQIINTN